MPNVALNELTHKIISCAIAVHGALGPGLFESAYLVPLMWELDSRGLKYRKRVAVDIEYQGKRVEEAYFIDILVEDTVVVELKSVQALLPVHLAQTITYVRLAQKPAGLLINFNVKRLVDGVRRVLNDRPMNPIASGA